MRRFPYLAKFSIQSGDDPSRVTHKRALIWAANREQAEGVFEEGIEDRGWKLVESSIKPLRRREGFVLIDD